MYYLSFLFLRLNSELKVILKFSLKDFSWFYHSTQYVVNQNHHVHWNVSIKHFEANNTSHLGINPTAGLLNTLTFGPLCGFTLLSLGCCCHHQLLSSVRQNCNVGCFYIPHNAPVRFSGSSPPDGTGPLVAQQLRLWQVEMLWHRGCLKQGNSNFFSSGESDGWCWSGEQRRPPPLSALSSALKIKAVSGLPGPAAWCDWPSVWSFMLLFLRTTFLRCCQVLTTLSDEAPVAFLTYFRIVPHLFSVSNCDSVT